MLGPRPELEPGPGLGQTTGRGRGRGAGAGLGVQDPQKLAFHVSIAVKLLTGLKNTCNSTACTTYCVCESTGTAIELMQSISY